MGLLNRLEGDRFELTQVVSHEITVRDVQKQLNEIEIELHMLRLRAYFLERTAKVYRDELREMQATSVGQISDAPVESGKEESHGEETKETGPGEGQEKSL
ncbi:hypothetical protein [Caudoviricetes sp.]|nr:hypothetical protein [Caudoviricetes sp.]